MPSVYSCALGRPETPKQVSKYHPEMSVSSRKSFFMLQQRPKSIFLVLMMDELMILNEIENMDFGQKSH